MHVNELRQLYWSEPFRPFELEMVDGRRIRVAEREWLAISPTGSTAAVAPTIMEFVIVDLPAVKQVHINPEAADVVSSAKE